MTQLVNNLPAMRETCVPSLGWEDSLEKGKATHSSILAWRIPWTTVHGVAESDMTERLSLSVSNERTVKSMHIETCRKWQSSNKRKIIAFSGLPG